MFSKFKFCGYLNLWVFKICGYSNLWVHKICDDTKFQVSGREYQNICVLCISCEQKNICAFFHICFLPYVQNIPCELAFRHSNMYIHAQRNETMLSEVDILSEYTAIKNSHFVLLDFFLDWSSLYIYYRYSPQGQ